MRKSRFLMSLIAATAIGLSAVGCGSSSDQGSIQDTTDLSVPGNNNNQNERRNLREYMLVGQRGLVTNFTPSYTAGSGQSSPTETNGRAVVAAPGDDIQTATAPVQLYEIGGISDVPRPNFNMRAPGLATDDPAEPVADLLTGISGGFHQVYTSPTGSYAIGMARSKDRGFQGDTVTGSDVQIFQLDFSPADVTFPPTVTFGPVQDPTDIRTYAPDQGEFVSGAWSSNAGQFYASISNRITVFQVDGIVGGLDESQVLVFPAGPAGTINNAVQIIASRDGNFVFAIDNANSNLVTYARAADGSLTQSATTPVVSDPRGATLDRTGRYMYIAGRASGQLAGYRIEDDGSLTAIDVFPAQGNGAVPFPFGEPLGDVASNPTSNQLVLATYLGVVQTYTIDTATGGLTATGAAGAPFGSARNCGNVEFEPSGRFVVASYEHDFDTFQPYVNPGNGWPFDESLVFANTNSASNGAGLPPLSATPNFDSLGRIVYVLPTTAPDTGSVQAYRLADNGGLRVEQSVEAANPYGLAFFQRVITPPQSSTPLVP